MIKFEDLRLNDIKWSSLIEYKDPEIFTLEILFILLTLGNLLVLYKISTDIFPFPVMLTFFQLLVGLILAYVLGETASELKMGVFPKFTIDLDLYRNLLFPSLVYLLMLIMMNGMIGNLRTLAAFPILASVSVCLHHLSRFVGCGQVYLPLRWLSLALMGFGYLVFVCFDVARYGSKHPSSHPSRMLLGGNLCILSLAYGLCSAMFRAWFLEKAMHTVEGKGNALHNHQVLLGVVILPFLSLLNFEYKMWSWMPLNFSILYTWQLWGCLVMTGIIPFLKNIIANRMIRKTGQTPWRFLELITMLMLFVTGCSCAGCSCALAFSFIVVLGGRFLCMLDAIVKDPDALRDAVLPDRRKRTSPAAPSRGSTPGASPGAFRSPGSHAQPLLQGDV